MRLIEELHFGRRPARFRTTTRITTFSGRGYAANAEVEALRRVGQRCNYIMCADRHFASAYFMNVLVAEGMSELHCSLLCVPKCSFGRTMGLGDTGMPQELLHPPRSRRT